METKDLDPRLRRIQDADLKGKIVLTRVDHNVVKKGTIKDPYRIEVTFKTLYAIAEGGGRPILMTHIGRPRDKKTGKIECRKEESVQPVIRYLKQKLPTKIVLPDFPIDPQWGITQGDDSIGSTIDDLKKGTIGMIYLPNIRWFQGEQSSGTERESFVKWLASLGDLYINDAFSSWRPHGSTYDIATHLPSYAGFQLQHELLNIHRVLHPQRPYVAVVAGAKYDTKIGPLKALYNKVDHLILGGLIYNTFLSAKYGVEIVGVSEEDMGLAEELVGLDEKKNKILEMPYLVESDTTEGKIEGKYRTVGKEGIKKGQKFGYLLDIAPESLGQQKVKEVIGSAKTVFVNAVMGLMPSFFEGTRALYDLIASNGPALKLFAGGDTLQELRHLCPGIYLSGLDNPDTYYFTGGGSVLTAIEHGSPYHLKPIEALMDQ